jgi:hypothetical protein
MDSEAKVELRRLLSEIVKADNLKAKFDLCEQAYPHLETFIADEDQGVFEAYPVVEHLARCYAATLNADGVRRICELIYSGDPSLAFGAFVAKRAVTELEYANEVLHFVNAYPGITQFAAREQLKIPKSDMANVLRYMEAFGLIRRTPTSMTNRLYPVSFTEGEAGS